MRLNEQQIQLINSVFDDFLKKNEIQGELYLYGSRTRDNLKGGDIDLLFIANKESQKELMINSKHILLASIKKKLGDQKIDLLVTSEETKNEDSFIQLIFPEAILLSNFRNNPF